MELKPEILQMNSFREHDPNTADHESMLNDTAGAASVGFDNPLNRFKSFLN